jgi:hypothetical protein
VDEVLPEQLSGPKLEVGKVAAWLNKADGRRFRQRLHKIAEREDRPWISGTRPVGIDAAAHFGIGDPYDWRRAWFDRACQEASQFLKSDRWTVGQHSRQDLLANFLKACNADQDFVSSDDPVVAVLGPQFIADTESAARLGGRRLRLLPWLCLVALDYFDSSRLDLAWLWLDEREGQRDSSQDAWLKPMGDVRRQWQFSTLHAESQRALARTVQAIELTHQNFARFALSSKAWAVTVEQTADGPGDEPRISTSESSKGGKRPSPRFQYGLEMIRRAACMDRVVKHGKDDFAVQFALRRFPASRREQLEQGTEDSRFEAYADLPDGAPTLGGQHDQGNPSCALGYLLGTQWQAAVAGHTTNYVVLGLLTIPLHSEWRNWFKGEKVVPKDIASMLRFHAWCDPNFWRDIWQPCVVHADQRGGKL